MNIFFWIALIFLFLCIPPILLIIAFYLISKKLTFSFKVVGYLKFKDILFLYENDQMQINLKLDNLQIYLIWLRCRVSFTGLLVNFIVKNKSLQYLKSRPVNKADFVETFVLQRKTSRNKNGKFYNDQPEYLLEVKNKYFEIIKDRYISKHLNQNKENLTEEEVIDNVLKKFEISKKDNFIRNLITFFDVLIENVEVNFKLSENETYHYLSFRKLILGVVKGINKHKEIHFICIAYDIKIKEYLKNSKRDTINTKYSEYSTYNEFILFNNQKIFLNLKLEYGLFPKSFYSLMNTINVKCDISKTKVELSTRAINSIFKIISQLIKLSKINEKNNLNINRNKDKERDRENNFNESNYSEASSLLKNYNSNNNKNFSNHLNNNYKTTTLSNNNPSRQVSTSVEIQLDPESLIECVEEVILAKIESQMKKMKIKINDMELKIVSDNHQYIFTHLNFSNFSYQAKNDLNYCCDSNKIKFLKSWAEVKIQDLILSSFKKEKVILNMQNYSLNLTEEIIYYHQSKEASVRGSVNSETPSVDVVINTKELDKIIELIICIVVGLEKLEAHTERNVYIHKYIEKYSGQTFLNLNFEKVNLTVYDDIIQTEINNIALTVRVEEEKFVGSKVDIAFNPFSVSICHTRLSTKYSSNIIIKGFKLNIVDDFKNSKIEIVFDDIKLVAYDNHLIDVLKFVADFLNYCLKGGVKNTYKKKTKLQSGYKSKYTNIIPNDVPTKKKESCSLLFKKIIVYNYVDFDDILTIKVKDFIFNIDEWMMMPNVKIYHQSVTNSFIKKRTEFITLERFYIKFEPAIHETTIEFGHIELNAYCFELAFVITKLSIYHSFLPVWINYHMSYKHSLDEDYRKIYVADFAKKDKNFIKFGTIIVKINQYLISSCAVLQTNPVLMANAIGETVGGEINYLRNLKCDQITINVKNFVLNTWGFKEKESTNKAIDLDMNDLHHNNNENNENGNEVITRNIRYYKKIIKKGEVDINFESIDIFQENSKLIELTNFHITMNDEFIYDNFELDKLNSIACSYKMHNIFYKELNSRKTKFAKMEILIENLKLNLEDIKIIDKITLFYINFGKTLLSFPFKEYALTEIMDNQKSEVSSSVDLYLKNFEAVVNSIDPLTNLIYNRLYLKIDLLSLSTEENLKVNKMELSIFYITFGFEFSQNFDYPLIIIPVCELNIDNMNNTIRINCPNKKLKKLKNNYGIKSGSDNPLVPADNLYASELDRFIMETKGFTLFLNFNYLNTFYKIFENFWRRSAFVKRYFFEKKSNSKSKDDKTDSDKKISELKNSQNSQNLQNKKNSLDVPVPVSGTVNKLKESINTHIVPNGNFTNSMNLSKISNFNNDLEFSTCINNESKEEYLVRSDKNKNTNTNINININNPTNNTTTNTKPFKIFLTLFDFKIIYLLQYKNEYNSILKFHTEVKDSGYFGYIIRFYSISLKYLNDSGNIKRDEMKLDTNLLTVSFLHEENFNDDKFFSFDKEIKYSRFNNLKLQKNFNEFMEFSQNNKYRLINRNLLKLFYYDDEGVNTSVDANNSNNSIKAFNKDHTINESNQIIVKNKYNTYNNNTNNNTSPIANRTIKNLSLTLNKENNSLGKKQDYVDLIFDHKHTLLKIFDISFKRDTMSLTKIEEIYIVVNDLKLTWNKFNMDVFTVLLFNDVLLIVDKIILKIDNGRKIDKKDQVEEISVPFVSVVDLGRFDFVFELNEPQICIQNEIKKSKVLLSTKSKCSAKISKICVNENSKDFKLEIQLTAMALYIAPNYMDNSYIYWIGLSEENMYYLEEKLFNKILETPKIQFLIYENIRNNPISQKADLYTNTTISVDKIAADFSSTHFNHFLNVIEVFIFDRGYSYAEEKHNIDSRAKDLELFRLDEIKTRIKMNTTSFISNKKSKQKEIIFTLKDVVLTMLKEKNEIIKLMMRNFEGEHIIYTDKSSETSINVKNLKILDLFKNKNETILTPNFEIQNIGELENKIDLVTFRKKDSYVSIGTESNWYVLDYYELNILPLLINTSKYHSDFIIEFFFNNQDEEKSEEQHKNILVGGDKDKEKNKKSNEQTSSQSITIQKNDRNKEKEKSFKEVSYPIYFKHVRINETQLFISFFLADNSPFNLRNAKLKFSAFEKKDKFYTYGVLLNRFIGHLKFISFTNASNILASLFNWGGGNNNVNFNLKKKKKDDEETHRKMLLGKQSNK